MSLSFDDEPEGATPLDPDETEGLKYEHITTRDQLNELEGLNIVKGQAWLRKTRETDILTNGFVMKLHVKMFGEVWTWAGKRRQTEKNIGVDPVQIDVQLRNLLDDASYWIEHGTYSDPKEIGIRLHHKLVQIHVFPNGNGRHARYFADHVMERLLDAEPIDWNGGQRLQNDSPRRNEYIDALRAGDAGDFSKLLSFVGSDLK